MNITLRAKFYYTDGLYRVMQDQKRDPNAKVDASGSERQSLVLSDSIKLPPTFSPEIASISLRSPDNSYQDGYSLRLSAHFGSDIVELELDSCTILAKMRINQARVELEFAKCKPSFGAGYEGHASNRTINAKRTSSTVHERSGLLEGSASASASLVNPPTAKVATSASGNVKGLGKTEDVSEEFLGELSFSHVNIDKITLKPRPEHQPLNGAEIFEYEGWQVSPNSETKSGVLAILKVKSDWIEIEKVDVVSKIGNEEGRSKVAAWIDGSRGSLEKRRQLFKLLLSNLVHLKLQDPREKIYANLDCSVICVEPEVDSCSNRDAEHQTLDLNLNEKLFEDFINAPTDRDAQEIAEHPELFLEPELIYEFPLCTPREILDALGITLSRTDRKKSWAQRPNRGSTMSEIERDIGFLSIPRRHDFQSNYKIDKTIPEPVNYVRRRASRVPIIAEGVQAASFENFGRGTIEHSFLGRLGRARSQSSMVRRTIDAHFKGVFTGRISEEQINRRISIATLWVEFVRDISR